MCRRSLLMPPTAPSFPTDRILAARASSCPLADVCCIISGRNRSTRERNVICEGCASGTGDRCRLEDRAFVKRTAGEHGDSLHEHSFPRHISPRSLGARRRHSPQGRSPPKIRHDAAAALARARDSIRGGARALGPEGHHGAARAADGASRRTEAPAGRRTGRGRSNRAESVLSSSRPICPGTRCWRVFGRTSSTSSCPSPEGGAPGRPSRSKRNGSSTSGTPSR